MTSPRRHFVAGLILAWSGSAALAQHEPRPNNEGPTSGGAAVGGAAIGGGWVRYGPANTYTPSYLMGTPGYNGRGALSAHIAGGPGIAFPFGLAPSTGMGAGLGQPGPGGLMLPQASPVGPAAANAASIPSPVAAPSQARSRSSRSDDLVEIGDRSFRSGNYRRAEDRYQQASRAQLDSPEPHVRLAQVALVRGDYNRAAAHIRDAVAGASGPGWLLQPRDIQAMFGEPGDFARQIAHLETHLQAHPQDRNAWFVLGAEQHLSGRHGPARDALLRLTDRPSDPALAAFLDATTIARRTESTHVSATNSHEPIPPTGR